jgi:16S rRNA (guanine527-N7)-methyltransferase
MEKILREGLEALGIPAGDAEIRQLADYGRLLLETNAVTNLTAIRDEPGVARLHFLDCAALLKVVELGGKQVIDVGSGAGFPGVPLRILQPDIHLTTVDSVGKKVDFVKKACQTLGLENVNCLWGRMEELPQLRESFQIAVSRAVAELDVLAELCLPQVQIGGLFVAMKGPECQDEVAQADFAIKALGGRVRDICRYTIPGTDVTHAAVIVEKVKPTPPQYPRRYAQIKKKPLRG